MEDGFNDSETFVLGIDVGTTSIKVSLLAKSTRDVVESFRCETEANICGDETQFAEQDVAKILSILNHALNRLSSKFLASVSSIGVCGQMHGCVMWKGQSFQAFNTTGDILAFKNNASSLITWEDIDRKSVV